MKARLIKVDDEVSILCGDGTIQNIPSSGILHFFSNFNNANLFSGTDGKWTQVAFDMGEYPGETLAYITDGDQLVVTSSWAMKQALTLPDITEKKYLTLAEYAKKHNRSKETIKTFARDGRISGAFKMGKQFFVPEDAPYPVDEINRRPTSGYRPSAKKIEG